MKILIQHNFNSGLGDFLKNITDYINALTPLKDKGYKITLYINLFKNSYINKPFFKTLFSHETYNFFDEIIETSTPIYSTSYNEYLYHFSSHEPQSPGIHQWDIFFEGEKENIDIKYLEASNAHRLSEYPIKLPVFGKKVIKRVKKFIKRHKIYNFLHVRTSDIIDSSTERYDLIINKLSLITGESEIPFYLGTNNKYIYEKMKGLDNIITYEFQSFDKFNNDMNAFKNLKPIDKSNDNILLNRLLDICAEMVLSSYAKEIYSFSDYIWISNFLFYPICLRKQTLKLTRITL